VEPYVFNVTSRGRYDNNGTRNSGARRHGYGSLTYVLYGLVDDFTVGVIPRFGYNDVSDAPDSSGVGLGDFTVQGTYRLAQYREGSRTPTVSLVLQETLPTGKYDRLGARPSDGTGSGAYTTTLSLNSQYFLWMPNGRIMRTRLNVSPIPDTVSIEDVSVYGTGDGFRGHADWPNLHSRLGLGIQPDATLGAGLDIVYQHDTSTALSGFDSPAPGATAPPTVFKDTSARAKFTLAPAVGTTGTAAWGDRRHLFTAAGRNASANIVPVAAINMVFERARHLHAAGNQLLPRASESFTARRHCHDGGISGHAIIMKVEYEAHDVPLARRPRSRVTGAVSNRRHHVSRKSQRDQRHVRKELRRCRSTGSHPGRQDAEEHPRRLDQRAACAL
jgi:hypothetical protein